jgi:hypothetical protein
MSNTTTTFNNLRDIDRCDQSALPGGPRAVLQYFQRLERPGQWHIASQAAVAAATGFGLRSVGRWIKQLVEGGFLQQWSRYAAGRQVRSGYKVMAAAVREVAALGFAKRTVDIAAYKVRMAEAIERNRLRAEALLLVLFVACGRKVGIRSATVADMTRQERVKTAWEAVSTSPEGCARWIDAVEALIQLGEGQTEADFRGFGQA